MRQATVDALIALDKQLTEKSQKVCEHTARSQSRDVYDLMSNLYYLSDGGYSRLRIADDFTVHLAQGARAEVQFNWEYAEREIKAVNDALFEEGTIETQNALCAVPECGFYHLDGSDYCASHG